MLTEVGFYRRPPEVRIEPSQGVFLNTQKVTLQSTKNATIRYTVDGRDPDLRSSVYTVPLIIRSATVVKASAFLDDTTAGPTESADFRKARWPVMLKSTFSPKYPANGTLALTDGLVAEANKSDPAWQGYEGNNLSAIVDLQGMKTVRGVSVGFLQDINSWVFFPASVEFSFSENGTSFGRQEKVVNDVSPKQEGASRKVFGASFSGVRCRYVKVVAANIGVCPAWHSGAGKKAWIFVDEIDIR